ncbi:MAG TPA: response regulator [Candidatus Acidoferrales bacterium]|nr:response regulator [Candidatus Acidoferrales bacterium]
MVVILELAFYGVFVATLVAYLRSRRPLERDVAAVFGSLAAVLALQFLRGHLPGGPTTITDLGVALLVSQPYLILRVVSHFRPLSRLVRTGSLGLLVATVALFCVGRPAHGTVATVSVLPVALYFFGFEALAVFYLAQESFHRVGVARLRLGAAAVASALFGIAILLSALGSASRAFGALAEVAALAAAAGYLFAFVAPRAVRRLGQRAAAYGFVSELAAKSTGATAGQLWHQLAVSAEQVTGAVAALVLIPDSMGQLQVQAAAGAATSIAVDLVRADQALPTTNSGSPAEVAGGHFVRVSIDPSEPDRGQVACYLTGNPLFGADDIGLVELFGALTLRMVERATLTEELREANTSLAQASAAKSEFLATMSHELRTPLNAVIGFSELLQDPQDASNPALTQEFAGHIRDAGMHLLDLINDVLDLSKVEAGQLELRCEKVDLAAVVGHTIKLMRPIAERKRITVQVQGPSSLVVWADPARVRQISYNLLSNALKFTPESGRVTVSFESADQWVCLSVVDNGPGVPEADRERIFDAFVQGELGGAQKEGTGLGLALTRRLVELHGGRLELESTMGSGSEFRVLLPAAVARGVGQEPPSPAILPPPTAPGHQRVLVIEDDPKVGRLLEIYLHGAGYAVEVEANGEMGLARAKAVNFDAILLDVVLPGIDGWQVLTSLKADPRTTEIPVLVVSVVDDRELGLALGAQDYLVKPISRGAVLGALSRVAKGHPSARSANLILGIDDDPAALRLYQATLRGSGVEVLGAGGGKEGLRLARDRRPDCILLDLVMPDLDGFEVLSRLKSDPETAPIPVIIVSAAQITEEDKERLNGHVLAVVEKGPGALSGLEQWLAQVAVRAKELGRV